MRKLQPFRFWLWAVIILSIVPAVPTASSVQDSQTVPVPVFPTGAVATFPEPVQLPREKISAVKVFIRPDVPADPRAWIVQPQEILLADKTSTVNGNKTIKTEAGVGFVVPQLPKGIYIAWYEPNTFNQRGQSIKLMIVPQLLTDEGIKRSEPRQGCGHSRQNSFSYGSQQEQSKSRSDKCPREPP